MQQKTVEGLRDASLSEDDHHETGGEEESTVSTLYYHHNMIRYMYFMSVIEVSVHGHYCV